MLIISYDSRNKNMNMQNAIVLRVVFYFKVHSRQQATLTCERVAATITTACV
jgi:hypothetical protein